MYENVCSKTSYNSPKYPSATEQINCGVFKLEYHTATRMNQVQQHKMWMNLTNLVLNEESHSQGYKL